MKRIETTASGRRPVGPGRWRIAALAVGALVLAACQPPPSPPPPPPSSAIVFDGTPGTSAPPATLGPFTMAPFAGDARPTSTNVSDVAGPTGTVGFGAPVEHDRIGSGWSSWSHGYTGDVYYSNGALTLVLTLPADTGAFSFYVEPNNFSVFDVTAATQDGTKSGAVPVDGLGGAKYFGFYGTNGATITSVTVASATAFAIGEFGIASATRKVVGLGDLHTWLTRWSPDPHTRAIDLQSELLVNGAPVAAGIARCIADLPPLFAPAAEVVVPWGKFAPVAVTTDDVLELRLSARIGTAPDDSACDADDVDAMHDHPPEHHFPNFVRAFYDGVHHAATFGLTITPDPATALFLHSDGTRCNLFDTMYVSQRTLDGVAPTAQLPRCTDSPQLDLENGNQWKVIGVWSMAPQP